MAFALAHSHWTARVRNETPHMHIDASLTHTRSQMQTVIGIHTLTGVDIRVQIMTVSRLIHLQQHVEKVFDLTKEAASPTSRLAMSHRAPAAVTLHPLPTQTSGTRTHE